MPVLPNDDRNLIQGLADFWVTFFKDTTFSESYFRGGQVMLGQLYLEICQAVLGTSLNHIPLFSKYYYRYFPVREDQVAFVEGATTEDDRFVYSPDEPVAQANLLMNRVIAPTRTLDVRRDYDVAEGSLQFFDDPFNVDGAGASLAQFPVRSVQVQAAAALANLRGVAWRDLGVRSGDTLWFEYPLGAAMKAVQIQALDDDRLMLDVNLPEFGTDLQSRNFRFHVVRVPYDHQKIGVETPSQAIAYEQAKAALTVGGVTLTITVPPVTMTPAVGQYVFVADATEPRNSVYARVTNVAGAVLTLDMATTFLATVGDVYIYLADHGPASTAASPTGTYPNELIEPGSLFVTGRRAVARVIPGTTPVPGSSNYVVDTAAGTVTYPAGAAVQENVDYVVDYFNGTLRYLSVWDPVLASRSDYAWKLRVCTEAFTQRGAFAPATAYAAGDVVTQAGVRYVARAAFTSGGSFDIGDWKPYAPPFGGDAVFALREIAIWAPDVLVDKDALYTNFGYLLGFKKPSSEQYRSFLKGVSQLFLLGPTIERFESALNVVAGLPVVRDDGEVLQSYDSGYLAVSTLADPTLGDGGQLLDTAYGRDGTLDAGTSSFSSPTAGFLPSDVGAVLRVRTGTGFTEFAITAISGSGTTATVAPVPTSATGVEWSYAHSLLSQRFRINSANVDYLFSESDIDAEIVITTANEPKNVGSFRVASVVSPREVVLDTPYGFIDAAGLNWRLTKSKVQTVTTSRASYEFPIRVPMKAAVTDPDNVGSLTFSAFDALSAMIDVVDYKSDPTWWHHITIPEELAQLENDAPGRRVVTPALIPHVVDAIDQAVINDFGLMVGKDDTGQPGIPRRGDATWLGGPWLRLDFLSDPHVPGLRAKDVGEYVAVERGPFHGFFKILSLSPDNTAVELERFPPRPARELTPPQPVLDVELPPILYRRTVAYVLMDRFLKYHAMQIRINTGGALSADFLSEATQLVKEAKPSHVFVYIEPGTSFVDRMTFTDSLLLTWGPEYVDHVHLINNDFTGSTSSIVGEYHAHFSTSDSGVSPGGLTTIALAPVLPYAPDRKFYVFGRFSAGTAGGKRLDEGIHYTFDRATGVVTVTGMDAGAWTFNYVVLALRQHAYAANWWTTGATNGETPSCVEGPDPLVFMPDPSVLGPGDYGFVDRPIEITIT